MLRFRPATALVTTRAWLSLGCHAHPLPRSSRPARVALAAGYLLVPATLSALGADLPADSTIAAVTVFPDRARMTRDIDVELLDETTPATETDVDERRGVLAWTYSYKPGEEREIAFG